MHEAERRKKNVFTLICICVELEVLRLFNLTVLAAMQIKCGEFWALYRALALHN